MRTYIDDSAGWQSTEEPECERSLDRLADISRTAERAAESIQKFLDRFHGISKLAGAKDGAVSTPVSGYSGQIDRLSKAVQECDDLARSLHNIG